MPKERPQATANDDIDNGGPAFPVLAYDYSASGDIRPNPAPMQYEGMTLRDWFAGQAISVANITWRNALNEDDVAKNAYRLADALLKARDL